MRAGIARPLRISEFAWRRDAGCSMATLIPAIGTCVSRTTSGERRFAERIEQNLDDDYLAWYDVPVGPKHAHPDFVILHPGAGY
jgi:hypothetical protein